MTVHHTPERLAIIRETWDQPVRIEEILARLNATPGHLPVTGALAAAWASQQGIRRHPHPRRVPIEVVEGVTEPVRLAALRRLATGDWTYARLEKLCDGWVNGIPAEKIAEQLGVSKNAVLGKVNRLTKRGLLSHRPSPIISRGPREAAPRPAPAPRAMNVPPPAVTLPPLLSGLPPHLSNERIWDGPPGFNFATGRPPLPTAPPATPLGSGTCLYPLWANNEAPTHEYCGKRTPLGSSYCPTCRAIVFYRVRAA